MAILFQSSSNSILSLKIFLISTTVLSAAIFLKLSAPTVTDFAVTEVPSIWNGVISWLKPPYLYLVINCIIITIVASSKLQNKLDQNLSPAPAVVSPENLAQTVENKLDENSFPEPATVIEYYSPVVHDLNGVVLKNQTVEARPMIFDYPNSTAGVLDAKFQNLREDNSYSHVDLRISEPKSTDYSDKSAEKPPASARFAHRKNVKSTPEGGKGALRVSKPKRQDTLESTWKTITEGRAMPLTRHLRKSDTWETHGGRNPVVTPPPQKMKKSETFNDRTTADSSPLLTPSPGSSGKLKKEPSPSQDELNRRVEAFIKKFNEDMRLQRQQSLQQYKEMINRGSH